MCNAIEAAHLMPGFICCRCHGYNGGWRERCQYCGGPWCSTAAIEMERIRAAATKMRDAACLEQSSSSRCTRK